MPETESAPSRSYRAASEFDDRSEPAPPPYFEQHIRPARPNLAIDPDHAARFGPYADAYRPEPALATPQAPRVKRPAPKPDPEADVRVKAANSNSIEPTTIAPPPLPEFRPATVVTMPRSPQPRSLEPRANITLQRETATFSVPVSEAVMPDSLKAAMRAFDARLTTRDTGVEALPDVIMEETPAHAIHAEDQLSDGDRAFLRRIAPPAAE
jgi:hypothetical protein